RPTWSGTASKRLAISRNCRQERDAKEQSPLAQPFGATRAANHLGPNSFRGDVGDARGALLQRPPGFVFNFKLEPSRKTNCTQHSQAVFRETLRRIADGADQFRFQIGPATDEIDHFVLHGIEKHSVDREIAPPRIFLWR